MDETSNRTQFDGESVAQKAKNPPQAGSSKYGARTRTKTPGAFLHGALAPAPEGRVSWMRRVIERSSMESP